MPTDDSSDLTILREIAAGDLTRFDLFVDRYKDRLVAYMQSRLRDYHLAEDLAQEVFLRVFRAGHTQQFNDQNPSLGPWIFAIARNCLIDHIRAQQSRPTTVSGEGQGATSNAAGPAASPVEQMLLSERHVQAAEFLEQLPDPQQEVIRLKILGGLTFAEVAAMLNCPLATVKSRMRYGLTRLHSLLMEGET